MFDKSKNLFLVLIILLLPFKSLYSQDVHFSQKLANDKDRNPAFLNSFEGSWQAMTIYRQQWQAVGVPFTTAGLMFTSNFYTPIKNLKAFAGLQYTNDKSGDAKLLVNRLGLNVGASYLTTYGLFSFAASNNLVDKSFSQNGLTFPSQYDRNQGGFNENLASGENFGGEYFAFYQLNMGMRWEYQLVEKWKINSGIYAQNVASHKESFLEEDNQKKMAYGFQVNAIHQYQTGIDIEPYFSFYRNNRASEIIVGSGVAFDTQKFGAVDELKPFLYFRSGFWRNTDALILGSSVTLGDFDLGASYDINISDLELASNYQGGFELTLIYTAKEKKLEKRRIPCVRY